MADEGDLPNLDLFIKVVGMTGSEHDGEAIAAMRRANSLLKKWGWDWDRLLRGKVKVVEDPFKSVDVPYTASQQSGSVPPRPQPAPPPRSWRPPPPPPPRPQPQYHYTPRRAQKPKVARGRPQQSYSLGDI